MTKKLTPRDIIALLTFLAGLSFILGPVVSAQMQQSGGSGSTTTASQGTAAAAAGRWPVYVTDGTNTMPTGDASARTIHVTTDNATQAVTASGTWSVRNQDGSGNNLTSTASALDVNLKSGSIANTAFGVSAGTANIGFVRVLPSSCTQSTNFTNATAQVGTGAGTTVTSTTTCITYAYANNITNSAVTLRLADKQGTPVIWLGGNADFSIPANSNMRIPIDGVTFTSGITAIAGTATAVNLQINGVQ